MENEGGTIKIVLIAVAGYLGYQYLQSSGLWAQWFGSGSSFTTAPALLAYCQANPTGTASFNGQSAPCAAWLQAASQQSPAAPATSQTAVVTPAPNATPLTVTQLLNAVAASGYPSNANTTYTVDQWNYFVTTQISPTAVVTDLTSVGNISAAQLTAAEYISLRQKAGLSGFRGSLGYANPYAWVH